MGILFSKTFLQKNFLQKSLLLLVVFLGGCELDPYPKEYLQYILGSGTGVKEYTDNPTMYFKINDEATSVTLYTTTSTTTLAYTDGDYNWGSYEGANFKLQLFDIHSKGGTFKLYSNNSLTDEDDFIWWFGDIPTPEPTPPAPTWAELATGKKLILVFDGGGQSEATFASGVVSPLFYYGEGFGIQGSSSSSSQEADYHRRDSSSNYNFYFKFYDFDEAGGKFEYDAISEIGGQNIYYTGTFTFSD